MRRRNFLKLSLASLASSALPSSAGSAEIPKLREIAHSKGLYFGTAVSDSQLHRPDFTPLLLDQCSILVAENQMKWRASSRTRPLRFHPSRFLHGLRRIPS